MAKLIIIGAGGHAKVVADCTAAAKHYNEIAFLDDGFPSHQQHLAWPVIGKISDWQAHADSTDFAIAIGNNKARLSLYQELSTAGQRLPNIIHPSAVISPYASLGHGNVIFANAIVNPGCKIANATIINTAASIDHDCTLADGVHVSPGTRLAGNVNVGKLSWLGIGSAVVQGIHIAENTQTGAGAVVTQSTRANSLYVGIPAKPIKTID